MRKTGVVSWSAGFGKLCVSRTRQFVPWHSWPAVQLEQQDDCWDIAQAGSSYILRYFTIFTTTVTFSQQEDCQKGFFSFKLRTGFSVSAITDSRCKCMCLIKIFWLWKKYMECNLNAFVTEIVQILFQILKSS